jgi:hypothetical protein
MDPYGRVGGDAEPNLASRDRQERDANVSIHDDRFTNTPAENEHASSSLKWADAPTAIDALPIQTASTFGPETVCSFAAPTGYLKSGQTLQSFL